MSQQVTWKNQLDRLYPSQEQWSWDGTYEVRARKYLMDVLKRSTAPTAVFVWKPSSSDKEWAVVKAEAEIVGVIGGREARNSILRKKIGFVGHASMTYWKPTWGTGWKRDDGVITLAGSPSYLSFWPGLGRGQFHTFLDDLKAEGRLPDEIYVNLSGDNGVCMFGKEIKMWNPWAIKNQVSKMQNDVRPAFHLLCKDGAFNCSKMVMSAIEKSVSLVNRYEEVVKETKEDSGGFFSAILKGVKIGLAAVTEVKESTVAGYCVLWKDNVRDKNINPNYIRDLFSCSANKFRIKVSGTEIHLINEELSDEKWCG